MFVATQITATLTMPRVLKLQNWPWENMVPQSWLSSAALCVMVVLGEGMCDVYYMQIFFCIDRESLSALKKFLSNHPAQMKCFFIFNLLSML